jgi:hypothetical protein
MRKIAAATAPAVVLAGIGLACWARSIIAPPFWDAGCSPERRICLPLAVSPAFMVAG